MKMGDIRAQNSFVGLTECFNAEHIGGSAVKDKKSFRLRTKGMLEFKSHSLGDGIISVGDHMVMVAFNNGLESLITNSRIIVACETSEKARFICVHIHILPFEVGFANAGFGRTESPLRI